MVADSPVSPLTKTSASCLWLSLVVLTNFIWLIHSCRALVVAMLVSFLWIVLMRWIAGFIVLLSIVLFIALFAFGEWWLFSVQKNIYIYFTRKFASSCQTRQQIAVNQFLVFLWIFSVTSQPKKKKKNCSKSDICCVALQVATTRSRDTLNWKTLMVHKRSSSRRTWITGTICSTLGWLLVRGSCRWCWTCKASSLKQQVQLIHSLLMFYRVKMSCFSGIICAAVLLIVLLLLIFLRKRILIAIALIKESSRWFFFNYALR